MNAESQDAVLFRHFGRIFQKDETIFREGDPGEEMYIIQKGKVCISRKAGDAEKTLMMLGDGEFFGEMSLLNNRSRSATAKVFEPSKVLVINKESFQKMIINNANFALKMITRLSDRLREADRQIEQALSYDKKTRILFQIYSRLQRAEVSHDMDMTASNFTKIIAGHVGARPNEVIIILNDMIKSGILTLHEGQQIAIKNRSRFDEMINHFMEKSDKPQQL